MWVLAGRADGATRQPLPRNAHAPRASRAGTHASRHGERARAPPSTVRPRAPDRGPRARARPARSGALWSRGLPRSPHVTPDARGRRSQLTRTIPPMGEIRTSGRPSTQEQQARESALELFRSAPIPDAELLSNLGLFLNRPTLTRILFMHELYRQILDV